MTASGSNRRLVIRGLVVGLPVLLVGYVVFYLMRPVAEVAVVTSGRAIHAVPGSVEVKAEFTMELKSEEGGRITFSALDPGTKIHKDDVLVQIDTGDIDLEIERIKDEIVAAKRKVELGSTMKLPRSGHGRLGLEVIELADQERPPMIRIPEYLEKRAGETGE